MIGITKHSLVLLKFASPSNLIQIKLMPSSPPVVPGGFCLDVGTIYYIGWSSPARLAPGKTVKRVDLGR